MLTASCLEIFPFSVSYTRKEWNLLYSGDLLSSLRATSRCHAKPSGYQVIGLGTGNGSPSKLPASSSGTNVFLIASLRTPFICLFPAILNVEGSGLLNACMNASHSSSGKICCAL